MSRCRIWATAVAILVAGHVGAVLAAPSPQLRSWHRRAFIAPRSLSEMFFIAVCRFLHKRPETHQGLSSRAIQGSRNVLPTTNFALLPFTFLLSRFGVRRL